MSWWRCFGWDFFFSMLCVASHAKLVQWKRRAWQTMSIEISVMGFCSPFKSWGWNVAPRLRNASDVTAIIQAVLFFTWGKSRGTQLFELLIKCSRLNVGNEVFCGRKSISHSAHPNTNHYLAFLIKDCTLVWCPDRWQLSPKAWTSQLLLSANFHVCFVYVCLFAD